MYFLFERGDKERGVGTPLKRPEIILFKAGECKKSLHHLLNAPRYSCSKRGSARRTYTHS
jgi:hypothetical protein